jgi:hypothetical protein
MLIVRLLCVVISITSGILGFSWAVDNDSSFMLELYVQSTFFALFFQIFLFAIVSKNKHRLLSASNFRRYDIRSNISISLSAVVLSIFIVMFFLMYDYPRIQYFLLFCVLIFVTLILQLMSFTTSSRQQISNLNRFWTFQLLGAIARLLSVILFIIVMNLSFIGLLLSNIVAAALITKLYKKYDFNKSKFQKSLPLIINFYRSLISIDGIVRMFRLYYEQIVILGSAIIVNILSFGNEIGHVANVATGYLNAVAIAMRQVFAKVEKDRFLKVLKGSQLFSTIFICLAASVIVWNLGKFTSLHLAILPELKEHEIGLILKTLSIYTLIYPLTIGFAFFDYFSKNKSREFAQILIMSSILILTLEEFIRLLLSDYGYIWPTWAIIPGLSIFISYRIVQFRAKKYTSINDG